MLSEKGIDFEVIEIDLKNKPDWFLDISPYGKVPVVKHGDALLYESSIINEYLDEVFNEKAMLERDPYKLAQQRIWIDFCNTRMQSRQGAIIRATPETFDEKVREYEESLAMLEEHLEADGLPAPYHGGKTIDMVDATYAPLWERSAVLPKLRDYDIPERFKRVREWRKALGAHPSVQVTATPLADLVTNYTAWLPESMRNKAVA